MRRIGAFLFSLAVALSVPQVSFAQAGGKTICPPGTFSGLCNIRLDKDSNIFGNIITILLILAVVVCLIFLILGGIKWITSAGDEQKVKSARSHITAALVGMVIAFLAYGLVSVIVMFFTGKGLGSFEVPRLVP